MESPPDRAGLCRLHLAAARYVDNRVAGVIDTVSPYRLKKIIAAAKQVADPGIAGEEAAEAADRRGVFTGRDDDGHGNKTMCIIAPTAAVNRLESKIAEIAEALKVIGDLRTVQHRRAAATGILADPRFTLELLTQAHHQTHTLADTSTTTTNTDATTTDPTPSRTPEPAPKPPRKPTPKPGPAPEPPRGAASKQTPESTPEPTPGAAPEPTLEPIHGAEPEPSPESGSSTSSASSTNSAPGASGGRSVLGSDFLSGGGLVLGGVRGEAQDTQPCDSLERFDLVEPVGPPEDPWLEAAGPHDPDPPTDPYLRPPADEPVPDNEPDPGDGGSAMDAAQLRALDARLAQIKRDAYTNPNHINHINPDHRDHADRTNHLDHLDHTNHRGHADCTGCTDRTDRTDRTDGTGHAGRSGTAARLARGKPPRPGQTEVVVHLTDHTLATGVGMLRAEGIGPLLAAQLTELVGHGPYTVKPVIDLNDAVSVNAYEIPPEIRERVRLMYPVELFPYGTRETTNSVDLDHIQPYDPHGPAGQTSTANLAPLGRFGHRVKTHARGWTVHRLDGRTLQWTTPHGFTFHVDPTGTHRVDRGASPPDDQETPPSAA